MKNCLLRYSESSVPHIYIHIAVQRSKAKRINRVNRVWISSPRGTHREILLSGLTRSSGDNNRRKRRVVKCLIVTYATSLRSPDARHGVIVSSVVFFAISPSGNTLFIAFSGYRCNIAQVSWKSRSFINVLLCRARVFTFTFTRAKYRTPH